MSSKPLIIGEGMTTYNLKDMYQAESAYQFFEPKEGQDYTFRILKDRGAPKTVEQHFADSPIVVGRDGKHYMLMSNNGARLTCVKRKWLMHQSPKKKAPDQSVRAMLVTEEGEKMHAFLNL